MMMMTTMMKMKMTSRLAKPHSMEDKIKSSKM